MLLKLFSPVNFFIAGRDLSQEPRRVERTLFFLPYTFSVLFSNKRNESSPHTKTWMNLTCILLSERIQSEEANTLYAPFIRHS